MAINITTTRKAIEFVKLMVYGETNVGKTKLVSTAPNPVLISVEQKENCLRKSDIPTYRVSTFAETEEVVEYLLGDAGKPFKTICIDSASEIAEMLLDEIDVPWGQEGGRKEGQPKNTMQIYGELGRRGLRFFKRFREFQDKHVYMIAKMSKETDEFSGIPRWAPSFPGNMLTNGVPYIFDYVFPLHKSQTEDGSTYRYLQTEDDGKCLVSGDHELFDSIEEPDLTKLFSKITNKN